MSASVPLVGRKGVLERPAYDAAFGLILVVVLLLSTLDEAAVAPVARGLVLAGFTLLAIVNAGAGAGVYMAAALVFSDRHFSGQGSWVERPDNYALLILTFYLVVGRSFGRSTGELGRTAAAAALLLATTFGHLVAVVGMTPDPIAWFLRMFGIPVAMFVLLRRAALSPREVSALLLIVAAMGVYVAVISLLEAAGLYSLIIPPWLADPTINGTIGWNRVGGLAMQPEWNALDISLAFCVLLLRLERGPSRANWGWLVGGGLCLLAIFFTYTRGAWVGLLMGGVPLFWQRSAARGVTFRRRALFVACVVGFSAFVLFFPTEVLQNRASDSGTMYFRFSVWAAGLGMVAENPLFGVGFGQFSSHVGWYVRDVAWIPSADAITGHTIAHNTFLSVAAELGLIGLALYVFVITGVFKAAWAAAGAYWGQRGRTWVAGFSAVYFVNVQFITAHELTPNLMYFGIMGAIAGMRARAGGTGTPVQH